MSLDIKTQHTDGTPTELCHDRRSMGGFCQFQTVRVRCSGWGKNGPEKSYLLLSTAARAGDK